MERIEVGQVWEKNGLTRTVTHLGTTRADKPYVEYSGTHAWQRMRLDKFERWAATARRVK